MADRLARMGMARALRREQAAAPVIAGLGALTAVLATGADLWYLAALPMITIEAARRRNRTRFRRTSPGSKLQKSEPTSKSLRKKTLDETLVERSKASYSREPYVPDPGDVIILDSNVIIHMLGKKKYAEEIRRFFKKYRKQIRVIAIVHDEVEHYISNKAKDDKMLKEYRNIFNTPVVEDLETDREYVEIRKRQKFATVNEEVGNDWLYDKRRALPGIVRETISKTSKKDRSWGLEKLYIWSKNDARILATAMVLGAVLVTADRDITLFARPHHADHRKGKIQTAVRTVRLQQLRG